MSENDQSNYRPGGNLEESYKGVSTGTPDAYVSDPEVRKRQNLEFFDSELPTVVQALRSTHGDQAVKEALYPAGREWLMENGYYASSQTEWYDELAKLSVDQLIKFLRSKINDYGTENVASLVKYMRHRLENLQRYGSAEEPEE